jgi:hypothetical protein
MIPLTVDGLIYASSMVMLDSAGRKTPIPSLTPWLPVWHRGRAHRQRYPRTRARLGRCSRGGCPGRPAGLVSADRLWRVDDVGCLP